MWTASIDKCGYGRVTAGPRQRKILNAHRVAWELVYGPIPARRHVLHKCDNPRCVRPEHLFLGTHQDNMDDMVTKKRSRPKPNQRGSQNDSARVTEQEVALIRKLYAQGVFQVEIGARFGIAQTTVSKIVRRATWGHIP